ncbi:MAG: glycosyltransferase family 39 protein [Candidatus Shapirobacteria bacterium]|nr:glycosyltransferase family 39 protein [Candidatus Shapirobacteria bacterium]
MILISVFTRFFNLNWGNGYFFHPDENNMASSVLQMNPKNLNPHFFAYGQFPLFLTFFTTPRHDFSTIVMTLRFWSATFSCLSILFFYLIIKQLFKNKKLVIIATLLFIFTPGLIQISHFGTTESILVFVFLVNIFLSLNLSNKIKYKYIYWAALISGIGLATKISGLIFILPVLFSLFFQFIKSTKKIKIFLLLFLFLSLTFIFSFIFSPFNLIDFSSFLSAIKYEIGVANGQIVVFYTRQFLDTIPYIFQFQKIFPYAIGLSVLFFSLIGLVFVDFKNIKNQIILFSVFIFFLYQGQLFVKWTRFMSPIFFIFPLLATFFISKFKNKLVVLTLVLISIIPGLVFFQKYFYQDIRVQASDWIIKNIPVNSKVLSESGNVVNLPIKNSNINVTNFDFYKLDNNLESQIKLTSLISESDYILIPSRRVFKNQNNSNFPDSQNYYHQLFSGSLGFLEIKNFSISNSLFLDSQNAEETWSVFDNPTIRIYKKQ